MDEDLKKADIIWCLSNQNKFKDRLGRSWGPNNSQQLKLNNPFTATMLRIPIPVFRSLWEYQICYWKLQTWYPTHRLFDFWEFRKCFPLCFTEYRGNYASTVTALTFIDKFPFPRQKILNSFFYKFFIHAWK